jgi:hypothetical protein
MMGRRDRAQASLFYEFRLDDMARRITCWPRYRHSYQMLADASGFYGGNVIEFCPPRGGCNPVGLRKGPDGARQKSRAPRGNSRMRLQPIAFARAHHYAAATHFGAHCAGVNAEAGK